MITDTIQFMNMENHNFKGATLFLCTAKVLFFSGGNKNKKHPRGVF